MKYNTLAFSLSLILGSQLASANPAGGQVVHGSATFTSPATNVLNVTNSNNTVINWQSFNIGAGQTTNFIQPSSASSVLNRVVTNNPSQLLGNLNSNGQVFLINQHGILVGEGAQINTAGFFASTLNMTDSDYLNGRLNFEGDNAAGINNQGYIHAGDNGNIVLIAPNIENGGVIEVDNGNVILAAGQSITISSLENPSIQFEVTGNENTVTNLGKILVDQGSASLFAGTLKHSGLIRAGGLVQNADGSISLVAKGSNNINGVVDASGNQGGYIEVLGETVTLENGAEINASGTTAGGEILIGGDRQGLNPDVPNATSTTVSAGASVSADATDNGNGGKVIVFAENDVHVHGSVTARGGASSGNGGFIETSGLRQLDITSVPDATAVNGSAGEWLIDPNNITIINGTGLNISGVPDFLTTDDNAILDVNLINFALNNGQSVTITTGDSDADNSSGGVGTQVGDITIQTSITKITGTDASLTLNAHNNIIVDAEAGGTIDISSTSGIMDLILNADSDSNGSGFVEFNTGASNSFPITINTNGGSLTTNTDVSIIGDVFNRSSGVNILNTLWVIPANTAVKLNEDLTIDAPGTVMQNNGEIAIADSNAILDLTFDTLNLPVGSLLSGYGTLSGDVTLNGGVIFAGDGTFSFDTLNVNGNLEVNSGGVYSVISTVEGPSASLIRANSITVNGGDLILNWESSSDPLTALNGDQFSVLDCVGTGCLNTSASGFDRLVHPITTVGGGVDYGISLFDTVTYSLGIVDTTNIVNWTGFSSINPTLWSDGSNWDTGSVPGSNSDIFISTLNGVDIAGDAFANGIQADSRITIGATGKLTINGNAFIKDPISGNGGLYISAADASVSGLGVMYVLGSVLNLDQGVLALDTVNWGEIRTSVGTPFQIDSNLVNNSLFALDANAGSNNFTGSGSIDNKGIMSWANGAQLNLSGGLSLSSNSANAQFQGSGLLSLNNTSSFDINIAPLFYDAAVTWELIAGSVSGVDNLSSLPNQIDWYSGTISSLAANTVVLASGQVLNLYGTSDMSLTGGLVLDNSGTINFLSSAGSLLFDGGLTNQSILNLSHTNNAAGFGGVGSFINNGTINLNTLNDFVVSNSVFTQNGALNIPGGNFILRATSDFNSGTLNIGSTGFFTVDTGGSVVLNSAFSGVTGNGRIVVSNGGIFDFNTISASSHNKDISSLSAFNINGAEVRNIQDALLPANFNISSGIVRGDGSLVIPSTTVINGGEFQGANAAQTLNISNTGVMTVPLSQSLLLSDSNLTIESTGSLSGGGSVQVTPGSSLIANGLIDISFIDLVGGTLTSNGLNYSGDLLWDAGTVDGTGLTTSGHVDLVGGFLNTDWIIDTTGTVNWTAPDYEILQINNGTITNKGEFVISSYVDMLSQALAAKNFSTSVNAAFINEGLLVIDADAFPGIQGADVIVFDLVFDNVGGTIGIQSGTFRIESGGVAQDLVLDAAGESLQGYGTFDGNVVNSAGTVSPGKSDVANAVFNTGTLTITGDFIQQVNGSLVIKMDSTASGLVHDTLNVGGTLSAGGDIRFAIINGKTPTQLALLLDQSFTPLNYGSFANRFDAVDIPLGLNFTFSDSGVINVSSDSQVLNDIANQLEVLFNNEELNHPQLVRAMRYIDEGIRIVTADEEDDERKRAPRLVCR